MMNAKDLEERLASPPPTHNRNINVDTHIGHAPQRPYALLEDYMASVTPGYRTVDDLQKAVAGIPRPASLPKGAPNPNEVKEDGGGLFRHVPTSPDASDRTVKDGRVVDRIRYERRGVALSMEGARAASEAGTPTDYFNGFTWLRNGFKPESDFPVMAQMAARGETEELVFEVDASPNDVAVLRHNVAALDHARAPLPVERSEPRASRREDK